MKYSFVLGLLLVFAPWSSTDEFTLTPFTEVEIEAIGEETAIEWFELYNHCQPIDLLVFLDSPSNEIGLTEDSLRIIAESRLRSARLYNSSGPATILRIFVSTTPESKGRFFITELKYYKSVVDTASKVTNMAITWETSSLGVYGNDKGFILNAVGQQMDEFIVEYLRVNELWCGKAG